MRLPGDHPPDVDVLLVELEEADGAVRALYRELAADPDRAGGYEPRLKDLHARRLDLAQRVGLASLARRRAWAISAATRRSPPSRRPPLAEATATSPPPVLELGEPEGPPSAPATDDQIAAWTSTVRSTGLGFRLNGAPSDSTAWPLILHELMEALGPPRPLDSSIDLFEEADALDAVGPLLWWTERR